MVESDDLAEGATLGAAWMGAFILSNEERSRDIKTSTTGDLRAAETRVECFENVCEADRGCAQCVSLAVDVPLDAQIVAIRQYHSAGGPPGDVAMRQVQAGEGAWCLITAPIVRSVHPAKRVSCKFFNRKHDRARTVRLEVDWYQ